VRVAALADVHGNAAALEAVLAELEREQPDLIVSCGDLTWGPLPRETRPARPLVWPGAVRARQLGA
jgi:predicted phosphodiesterase